MKIVIPAQNNGEYKTIFDFEEKKNLYQDFQFVDITCETATVTARLAAIRIPDWKIDIFKKDLDRLPFTGRAKLEIHTREKEEFLLTIRSFGSGESWSADVYVKNKSNFLHVKYEIDPKLIKDI